ncbi:hypothetical protein QN372_01590 [Undibacterium sp. RTI2.1]|uniref:hypothetical protein n=1 Tax=unclassified Undibacterium TaxID=2630295 RepID=UPI002B22B256|nr:MULTISPECIES: hypothetical protein [unclassified Undibacterium]MEB0029432.1 hypothetical protein [Undibacterium sp. RTI2.1]MEB0115949.1 hypothetical protein [Undibacterium sp. RTI2.2]
MSEDQKRSSKIRGPIFIRLNRQFHASKSVFIGPLPHLNMGLKMKIWLLRSFRHAAWAPLSVFAFYAIVAKGFNAYLIYPWLDMPTHFFGGMAITYFYLITASYSQVFIEPIPRIIQLILPLGLTTVTAVVWEFWEYLSDVILGTKMNLGVSDTLSDLFFGLFGACFLMAVLRKS